MTGRGVHFALRPEQAERLVTLATDEDLLDFITEHVEAEWDEDWLQETDKAWDAIHRCLTDGTLNCTSGSVLEKCVAGGEHLYQGDDYFVSFIRADETEHVASALVPLDNAWIRAKYRRLDPEDYGMQLSREDEDYTTENFLELKKFYQKAAGEPRAVVFTVDQ